MSGATVQVEPFTVAEPTLDIEASSLTSIKLDWAALTDDDTGGSPITSYELQWDANTNGLTFSTLKGEEGNLDSATTFTETDLSAG